MRKTLIYPFAFVFLIFSTIAASNANKLRINRQEADQPDGMQLYTKYCKTCHQVDGKGVRGMFPPLSGNAKVTGPASDVIKIVLFGLQGPITVNDRDYDQVMPPQGYLSDKQIADILSYVRSSWENKASPVKQEDVAKIRKQGKPN